MVISCLRFRPVAIWVFYPIERFDQGEFMSTIDSNAPAMPPQAVIMQMIMGVCIARVISEVSRLDIPDALKQRGHQSAAELISSGIDANAVALERVLRSCASFGLFTENSEGKFGATDLSDVLTVAAPASVKVVAEEVGGTSLWHFGPLAEGIRTGEPVSRQAFGMEWWDYLNANPAELERFGESMKSNSLNSMLGVLEKCNFGDVKKVIAVPVSLDAWSWLCWRNTPT
jgi:hypothetical protein